MSAGTAERLRQSYLDLVAGDEELLPEDVVSKIRVFESVLPMLSRLLRIPGRPTSLAELLPATDDEATAMLELLHGWSGRMLDPAGAIVDGRATRITGEEPVTPAPSGTLGAGEPPPTA